MKKIKRNEFVDNCEDSLRSVSARFGLKLIATRIDKWYTVAEFANDTTGVIFRYERRESLVHIELAALQSGKIVPLPASVRDDTPLSTVPLGDVLIALGASDEACQAGSSKATIRHRIDRQVSALEAHATNVLEGDFASFATAGKYLKSRLNARRRPISASDKEAFLTQFPQLRKFL